MGSHGKALRVLVAGGVGGKLDAIVSRVQAVVKKSGPFDLLLCVGTFDSKKEGEESGAAKFIRSGNKSPIPTYFIGCDGGESCDELLALLEASPESNIKYLGRCGVTTILGLKVAYYDDLAASQGEDGGEVDAMLDSATSMEGDIDLLLTNYWPSGVLTHVGKRDDRLARVAGNRTNAKLAQVLRPRYHFSAMEGKFHARLPYANPDLGTGSHVTRFIGLGDVGNGSNEKFVHALGLKPASDMPREAFLSRPADTTPSPYEATSTGQDGGREKGQKRCQGEPLSSGAVDESWRWAGVNNNSNKRPKREQYGNRDIVIDKRKSVFVRNLPFHATREAIEGFFSSCGSVVDIRRGHDARGQAKGYAQVQFENVAQVEESCKLNETQLMGRPIYVEPSESKQDLRKSAHPVADCWFCLSNPNADIHLVVSVSSESYCALDKGPLCSCHALVVPIEHIPCTLELSDAAFGEIGRYLAALRTCFAAQGMETVVFERYLKLKGREGGNHCHYNVVGIPKNDADDSAGDSGMREEFLRAAETIGFTFQDVAGVSGFDDPNFRERFRDVVGDMEYMMAVLPDGSAIAHPIMRGERIPYNFIRDVIAGALGVPERGDWKKCKLSQEEESSSVTKFKAIFGPHDIMNS